MTDEEKIVEEKLYAGKFKSIEELENGYKNAATTYDENQKLKADLKAVTEVPIDYTNPTDIQLEEHRIADIKARAKEAGMTQAQYEKFVRSDKARVDQYKASFEEAKKSVGDSTINVLKDYVSKNYPQPLQEGVMSTLIQNKEARYAALKHRETLLNSSIPGMNNPAIERYAVTQEDVDKAYKAKEAAPHDIMKRQAYLNILDARARQKAQG